MNPVEARQVWQVVVALGIVSAFVMCYVRGGRSGRAIRFLGGGLTFSLGCCLLAIWSGVASVWMLLSVPAYVGALSVGYSGETTADKVRRRAVYGFLVGGASAPLLLPLGLWWPCVYQVGLAAITNMFFGITNPARSAVGEEAIIAMLSVGIVPFCLF